MAEEVASREFSEAFQDLVAHVSSLQVLAWNMYLDWVYPRKEDLVELKRRCLETQAAIDRFLPRIDEELPKPTSPRKRKSDDLDEE